SQFSESTTFIQRTFGIAAVDARRRTTRPHPVRVAGRATDPLVVAAAAGEDAAAAIIIVGHIAHRGSGRVALAQDTAFIVSRDAPLGDRDAARDVEIFPVPLVNFVQIGVVDTVVDVPEHAVRIVLDRTTHATVIVFGQ